MIYVDKDGHYIMCVHVEGEAGWDQVFDLSTTSLGVSYDNYHHTCTIGVDTDGYIHVSGNMHGHPLNYIRSLNPGDITAWETAAMVGTSETSISYPCFIRNDAGSGDELLFIYRQGGSGDGDEFLDAYDETTRTWTRRAKVINGQGNPNPALRESAYRWGLVGDPDSGRLWMVWNWRLDLGGDQAHDVCAAYSDNNGATWYTPAGVLHASTGITPATGYVLVHVPTGTPPFLEADPGFAVRDGELHVAANWMDDDGVRQIHHIYHDGSAWVDVQITDGTVDTFRAQVISTPDAFYIFYALTVWANEAETQLQFWYYKRDLLASYTDPPVEFMSRWSSGQWDHRAAITQNKLMYLNDQMHRIEVIDLA